MNVPHYALFQNCINGSASPNRRAARAPDKKSFKWYLLLNHWPKFKIISRELFLIIPFTKIAQIVTFRRTKGLSELQIRNTFKWHFLLIHWSKFKTISQNCSSWYLIPKLHKMVLVEREVTFIMHIRIQAWNLVEMVISMSYWNFSR